MTSSSLHSLPVTVAATNHRWIDLSLNKITSLTSTAFATEYVNMLNVNLTHNAIEVLPDGMMSPFQVNEL